VSNGRIAIVGTGLIGRAWSISFARAGYDVALFDPHPQAATNAIRLIAASLGDLEPRGLLHGRAARDVLNRIQVATSLTAALDGAAHVQECAPESLPLKQDLYVALDSAAAPDAILCSSTSALLPSAFTAGLPGRHRCLVGHPVNPPHLVPAVELVPAPWTSADVMERTRALMVAIGQAPVVMSRELAGFIVNRLQGALLQEAFRLVADGVASAEDVDVSVKKGLGLRWAFIGPFETIDLNAPGGVADYIERFDGMYRTIAATQGRFVEWTGELARRLDAQRAEILPRDKLDERQGWRDRRLMALAVHLRQVEQELGA
jgi:3-hydroxyacyl-CoA dehydrogenase